VTGRGDGNQRVWNGPRLWRHRHGLWPGGTRSLLPPSRHFHTHLVYYQCVRNTLDWDATDELHLPGLLHEHVPAVPDAVLEAFAPTR
jgi:hypothetical protein